MISFCELLNKLSNQQVEYTFPFEKGDSSDESDPLDILYQQIDYYPDKNEFELIQTSIKENSILVALVNLFIYTPSHHYSEYISQLKNFTYHWMIVFKKILQDTNLNSIKLNYYLNSNLDNEELLVLYALIFNVNIIVINLDANFKLYSPDNIDNLYIILYLDKAGVYHAVKYQPTNKDSMSNLTGYISIIEPNHPLVKKLLEYIFY